VPVLPGDTPNTLHRGTPLIAAGSAAAASTQRSSSDIVEQRSQNVNSGGPARASHHHHQPPGASITQSPHMACSIAVTCNESECLTDAPVFPKFY
jgi:hypothetical protein